jgi:plasmid stabilization system protein ParE|tara:strand:- start:42524 stop:42802 length:279 start_codon:yes stop_codon:yes gene_type:complete
LKVVLSRRANLDLIAQIDWLVGLSPSAALHAETVIRAGLETLVVYPRAGRSINAAERKWVIPFGRDGFVVIYRIEADRVVIGRIFHSSQSRD